MGLTFSENKECKYLPECRKESKELKCPEYWIDCNLYRTKVRKEVFEKDSRVKPNYIERPDKG